MACFTVNVGAESIRRRESAVEKLKSLLGNGSVTVVIGKDGALAFNGWKSQDRDDVTDVCAYRRIAQSPEMKRAIAKAEVLSGRKVNERAIASGMHSHDGGKTWSSH